MGTNLRWYVGTMLATGLRSSMSTNTFTRVIPRSSARQPRAQRWRKWSPRSWTPLQKHRCSCHGSSLGRVEEISRYHLLESGIRLVVCFQCYPIAPKDGCGWTSKPGSDDSHRTRIVQFVLSLYPGYPTDNSFIDNTSQTRPCVASRGAKPTRTRLRHSK